MEQWFFIPFLPIFKLVQHIDVEVQRLGYEAEELVIQMTVPVDEIRAQVQLIPFEDDPIDLLQHLRLIDEWLFNSKISFGGNYID